MTLWNRVAVGAALTAGLAITTAPATAAPALAAAPKGSCTLVTVREAGRILGTPTRAGKRTSFTGTDECKWAAKKKGTGGLKGRPLQLAITVSTGPEAVADYQEEKTEDPSETEAIPGLGDEAFIRDLDVNVLVGERVVVVELHNYRYPKPLTEEQIQQKEEDAARIALGRLR
jgi:hypothetical protein